MSASGAKVMALRSIEVARSYGVKLRVRSTFVDGEGTWIGEEDEDAREGDHLRGHARHVRGEGRRSSACPTGRASPPRCSATLADAGVNIDMIVQNVSQDGAATITFTLPKTDLPIAEPILDALSRGDRRAPASTAIRTSRRSR